MLISTEHISPAGKKMPFAIVEETEYYSAIAKHCRCVIWELVSAREGAVVGGGGAR